MNDPEWGGITEKELISQLNHALDELRCKVKHCQELPVADGRCGRHQERKPQPYYAVFNTKAVAIFNNRMV